MNTSKEVRTLINDAIAAGYSVLEMDHTTHIASPRPYGPELTIYSEGFAQMPDSDRQYKRPATMRRLLELSNAK